MKKTAIIPVARPGNGGSVRVRSRCKARQGFTLIEVLVSIALVLIIILGVNQVFALTGRAVGAGQALSETNRLARSAQNVITKDLSNADVIRGPFLWISSESMSAFRNKADRFSDLDFTPSTTTQATVDRAVRTLDRDANGSETDVNDLTPRTFMTKRTHRLDQLGFFTRVLSRRQTGDGTSYTTAVASGEQYIVYSHILRPDNNKSVTAGVQPGIGFSTTSLTPTNNPNNYYASDWVLGRTTFVMKEPEVDPTNAQFKYIYDAYTNKKLEYYTRGTGQTAATSMAPFSQNSQATVDGKNLIAADLVQRSYFDVAGFSMDRYRDDLAVFANNPTNAVSPAPPAVPTRGWFLNVRYRYIGSPFPIRPLTRQSVAQTVPCFIPACTQFAVEYAGDFLAQDPSTGAITGTAMTSATAGGTDGEIDYILTPDPTKAGAMQRTIRWYGFPRDVNNDGKIVAADDVVPLRDVANVQFAFERIVPTKQTNYGTDQTAPLGMNYFCAWGPDAAAVGLPRPKLIRITMAIDDPAGRIAGEQYFQFVVPVQ